MKIGIRTPSLKKSIKARTTGKIKRKVKSTINPLYGKKGMGYINEPQKAVYNKIYNKTTTSAFDISKSNIIVKIIYFIVYAYYLLFKYCFYIPIKWIINKIKNK